MSCSSLHISDSSSAIDEVTVSSEWLQPDPLLQRWKDDDPEVAQMASSLEQFGQISPIRLSQIPGSTRQFTIADGYRRVRAGRIIGLPEYSAIVSSQSPDLQFLAAHMQPAAIDSITMAGVLGRLKSTHGYTHKQLGELIGKERSTITQILRINSLPAEMLRNLREMRPIPSAESVIALAQSKVQIERDKIYAMIAQGSTREAIRSFKTQERAQLDRVVARALQAVLKSGTILNGIPYDTCIAGKLAAALEALENEARSLADRVHRMRVS